jgi:hypothetical protein
VASAPAEKCGNPAKPSLPPSDVKVDLVRTALVVLDPQIDVLRPKGAAWGGDGPRAKQHSTLKIIAQLFVAAPAAFGSNVRR